MKCNNCKTDCVRKFCSTECYHSSRKVECPQEWIDLYDSGWTIENISKYCKKSIAQVSVLLRRGGAKMRNTAPSEDGRKRIADNRKKYFENPANREKVSKYIRKYHLDPAVKEKYRQNFLERRLSGAIKYSQTSKLETTVADALVKRGIEFRQQVSLRFGSYVCRVDFMLANGTIVEVNGTYWHCDHRKYPKGPINKVQSRCLLQHQKKCRTLEENGFVVIHLWEQDLRSNMDIELDKIR